MVTYRLDATDPFGTTVFEGDLVQIGFTSAVSDKGTLDPSDLMESDMMSRYREIKVK